MITFSKKSIAILLGIVFFAGGALTVTAAIVDTAPSQGAIIDTATNPTFGIPAPSRAASQPVVSTAPVVDTSLAASVNGNSATTAIMANAVATGANAVTLGASSGTTAFDPNAAATDAASLNLNCNILNGALGTSGKFVDCVSLAFYYALYKPASWILIGSVYIFDTVLVLSIDKGFIIQPFIASSWTIIRDFSNMLFIFILLYTGISTMLGMGNWRKTVIQVVIIALLINFSLFFTKVVIDAGNILAVGIYSSMGTPKAPGEGHLLSSGVPERNIATDIAGSFQPQTFQNAAGAVDAMDAIIIFIIAAVVSIIAAWVFFKASLLFIGRLIAFWFLMIVSPFAFISTAFPKGNKFDQWLKMLLDQAFVAPLFLFLIYLIMQVVNAGNGILSGFTGASSSSGTAMGFAFQKLIAPVLVATLLIIALQKSLKLAEGMAGEFGQLGAKLGGAVMGIAGGAVLGGAAVAGRKVVGGAAQRLEESGKLQQWATSKDSKIARFAGRNLIGANDKVRTGTFDARGLSTIQKAAGAAGVASIGKPWASAKGGYEGEQKRQGEKDEKFAKRLEMTADEKKSITEAHGVEEASKEEAKHKEVVAERATNVVEADEAVKTAKKKVEEAQAAHEASRDITGAGDATLAKALADATKEEQGALSKLKGSQTDLAAATELADKATAAAKEAKKEADTVIESENKRRAGKFADYVENRIFVPTMGTYSHKQAQTTAAKIRKGKTKDEKEKETRTKNLLKTLKEMEEKEEEKPAEAAH